MTDFNFDVVIIGGGPAGLTAGLYAARSRLKVVLLERMSPGGQVLTTEWVENYPGFPEGISGFELIDRMKSQAEKFGLVIRQEEVQAVDFNGKQKRLHTTSGIIESRSVIVASGAHSRKLGVPGEERLTGKGVSYCATCDGPFFSDGIIAVVGGGDMAVEEGIYLTKFARKVCLIHRRNELRAARVLQERALANDKIEIFWDTVVTRIEGEDLVNSVLLKNIRTSEDSILEVEGIFVLVGTVPSTIFLQGIIALDEGGFIKVNREMETSIPGVFAAGDVTNKVVRQISTAVGEGAIAAMSAERYVQAQLAGAKP
jgi:thioredoxin reductase (NADPH)